MANRYGISWYASPKEAIKKVIRRKQLLRSLRNNAKYGAEWDINDIGSVSIKMKNGTTNEYLFFWPYGWKDGLSIDVSKVDKMLECTSMDDVYMLVD